MIALWGMCVALGAAPDDAVAALDAYAEQRLDVVERDVTTVYAASYDGSGRFWFVEQGERRLLPATEFAALVGDTDGAEAIRRRHRRSITGGTLLTMTGAGFGMVAALSLVPGGLGLGDGPETGFVAVGSAVAAVGGLVGGPLLIGRGLRSRHPSALYTAEEARTHAQRFNAELRDQLLDD